MCFAAAPGAWKAEIISAARTPRATAALLALFSGTAWAAELKIQIPEPDSLVHDTTITVSGTADPGEEVMLQVGSGAFMPVESDGARWFASNVNLIDGSNVLTVTSSSDVQRTLVTRANVASRGKQKVFFEWDPAAETELMKIAAGTLQPVPAEKKQKSFVTAVKAKTATIFADNFSRFNIELVATPDAQTHVIKFMPNGDSSTYGQSKTDCLNAEAKGQASEVWVGTLRARMVPLSSEWAPMSAGDPLKTRISDVAHSLARTASHEFGHALGLVSEPSRVSCKWMAGCLVDHNCPDNDNELVDRFGNGFYIMDPGTRTKPFQRIAEQSQSRGAKAAAKFEEFGSDYLSLIHPP